MIQFSKFDKKILLINWIVTLSVLVCFSACSKKSDTSDPAPGTARNPEKGSYEEIAPPIIKPVFRWDFSKPGVVHKYTYDQDVRSGRTPGMATEVKPEFMTQEMAARGLLVIKSHGDQTADFILTNMNALITIIDANGEKSKPVAQPIPDFALKGLKEDGTGLNENNNQDMLIKSLFPLPSKSLKVGESIDIPMQLPFNTTEKELTVTGHTRITLSRYVKFGNRLCAQLNTNTEISEMVIPPDLKGKYKVSTKGNATFYFDVENRIFVSGTANVFMAYDVTPPVTTKPGKNNPAQSGSTRISMASENSVHVKLVEEDGL